MHPRGRCCFARTHGNPAPFFVPQGASDLLQSWSSRSLHLNIHDHQASTCLSLAPDPTRRNSSRPTGRRRRRTISSSPTQVSPPSLSLHPTPTASLTPSFTLLSSAWGHTRPLLSLTLALLLRHPHLTATLLIYDPLLPKCLVEIEKWGLPASDRARLQISSFGSEATKGEGLVRREAVSSVGYVPCLIPASPRIVAPLTLLNLYRLNRELAVEAYAAHYTAHILHPPTPTPTSATPTSDAVKTTAIILDASIAPAFLARKRALDVSAFGESAREEQGRNGGSKVKVLTFHPASSGYVGL